jgi:SAM-dependent methyltransferase
MPDAALELLTESLETRACLQLVVSGRAAESTVEFTKVVVRPAKVGQRSLWQFTFHFPKKVTHENLATDEAVPRVAELLARAFDQAALFTPHADYLIRARADRSWRVTTSAPTRSPPAAVTHNRPKHYLIPERTPCPFLEGIGVMTPDGQVRRAMYHKFRQINRFLELVEDVVPALPENGPLHVVDFGCGKSYLTFAIHHLLTVIHRRPAEIVGLDREAGVIRTCRDLARQLGCAGLDFHEGDIASYAAAGPVDLAVSLHACDTATDAALARGVRWECAAILAVPCCQHELAPRVHNDALLALTRHGVLHERFSALSTDALRAAILETRGYATQIVEFIDMEHTAKNLLIRAVRRKSNDESIRHERASEYARLLAALGIESFALARELGIAADGTMAPGHSTP